MLKAQSTEGWNTQKYSLYTIALTSKPTSEQKPEDSYPLFVFAVLKALTYLNENKILMVGVKSVPGRVWITLLALSTCHSLSEAGCLGKQWSQYNYNADTKTLQKRETALTSQY